MFVVGGLGDFREILLDRGDTESSIRKILYNVVFTRQHPPGEFCRVKYSENEYRLSNSEQVDSKLNNKVTEIVFKVYSEKV